MGDHNVADRDDAVGRLRLRFDEEGHAGAKIKVIGVGGGGSNAATAW
jgi:cell division GTPase FtsZ